MNLHPERPLTADEEKAVIRFVENWKSDYEFAVNMGKDIIICWDQRQSIQDTVKMTVFHKNRSSEMVKVRIEKRVMTVGELMDTLKNHDPDKPVCIPCDRIFGPDFQSVYAVYDRAGRQGMSDPPHEFRFDEEGWKDGERNIVIIV